MPWDELLSLWSDVDRFSYLNVLDDSEVVMQSVYARRFRNATVTQSSSVFVEDPTALQGHARQRRGGRRHLGRAQSLGQ